MTTDTPRPWTPAHRVGFRFLFIYLVLFFFPFPQGLVNPQWLGNLSESLWRPLVPRFAALLGVQATPSDNGSGDTAFDYLRVLLMVIIAALGAVTWTLLDRRRPDYRTLQAWSRIWLRYALALTMLTYGSVKVVMLQFEPPGYGRLTQPLGDFSPMALLWIFMGSSPLYTSFTGVSEVIAATLLLFRRTTTLGALLVAGIMSNVAMLNLSYDVPVKLAALHILLLALVLLAPETQRLLDFFVFNRPTAPSDLAPRWHGRTLVASSLVKALFIASILVYLAWDTAESYQRQTAAREQLPVAPDGTYRLSALKRDGQPLPPLPTDEIRWQRLSLKQGVIGVRTVDGSVQRFKAQGDPCSQNATLVPCDDKGQPLPDATPAGTLRLTLDDHGAGTLTGTFAGHQVEAAVLRQNRGDFPLISRGFRWISPEPYFR
jgi:hypothetical protein